MATQTPAEALGGEVAARKGRIAPGYDADLAILDADWHVVSTVVRGAVVEPATMSGHDSVGPPGVTTATGT
jgi:N-acetylglucosamine-6-phosphate deacetylase